MAILEVIEDDTSNPLLLNKTERDNRTKFDQLTAEEQEVLLDHISAQVANDPAAARRLADSFLSQTTKNDFNTVNVQPQAGFVCKTHVTLITKECTFKVNTPVYINVCYANAIPAPPIANEKEVQKALNAEPDSNYKVPLSMGDVRGDKDCLIMDACINTQPYLRCEKDLDFKLYMLELSMEYVEDITHCSLSREFTMPNIKSKGTIPGRVLRLPKPSLITAIKSQSSPAKAPAWKPQPDMFTKNETIFIIIPMPDKNDGSWTIDIALDKVILSIEKDSHEILLSNEVDISNNLNKVDFYKQSQSLVLQLKTMKRRQYL